MDKVRWLREALLAVDLVEEEPERELLEPEEEELGLTRWALGASASSLQANTHRAQTAHGENRNTRLTPLQSTRVYPANCPTSVLCDCGLDSLLPRRAVGKWVWNKHVAHKQLCVCAVNAKCQSGQRR